jgi:hypothetical protein
MSHVKCRVESIAAMLGGVLIGALGWATLLNFGVVPHPFEVAPLHSVNASTVQCDEAWQAPDSEGADNCRLRGWTVRRDFILTPANTVAYLRLNPCVEEESDGPCFWNAERQGNGTGTSFIIKGQRDGKHRVWWVKFR